MTAPSPAGDGGARPLLETLGRDSARGAATTFLSQAVSIAIQVVSTAVLARLLAPEDFGVVAMVASVTALVGLVRDVGLSAAAIQQSGLSHAQQSNLFWLNLGGGLALTVVTVAAAPGVAWFFGLPELWRVTAAMSLQFAVAGAGSQFGADLLRRMRFGRHAVAGIAGALVSLAVAAGLAWRGLSYWAIVWGNLAGVGTNTALLAVLSGFRPGRPSRGAGVRGLVRFGAQVMAFDLVNYFARNADNVLIGRLWGPGALGLYSRAYSLLMFPITSLRNPITAVAFPALSRLRADPDAFRAYYVKVTAILALLSMPLVGFLFGSADLVIDALLGDRWGEAATIFRFLALAAVLQPVWGLSGSLLMSLGQGARFFQCGAMNAVIVCTAFAVGVRWGALGVACAYSIANWVGVWPNLLWAFGASPVRVRDVVRVSAFPLALAVLVAAATLAVRHLPLQGGVVLKLVVAGSAAVAIALVTIFLHPAGRASRGLLADARQLLARR